jgi:hypothetical protein
MTYRLIYRSEATDALNDAELRSIAMFSALNNKAANISGLLLHHNGQIMQVLEGKADALQDLYSRIEKDDRHVNVTLLVNGPCTAPVFKEWSMGYRPVNSPGELDIFFALTRDTLKDMTPDQAPQELTETIEKFAADSDL